METKRVMETTNTVVPFKKPKLDVAISEGSKTEMPRTSSLQARVMLLTGHSGEIFTGCFSPDGSFLASAGFDRQIFLYSTYGECENFLVMAGHKGAILELRFTPDGDKIYTCATDKLVCGWDIEVGVRIKKFQGHTSFVNSCQVVRRGPQLVCSGSDDGTVKLWDPRRRGSVNTFQSMYQVIAVTFNDTGEQIISGGLDNEIKVWDLRKQDVVYRLRGHTDTVTGLSVSHDGSYVLSNSMDNSCRMFDVRPYVAGDRCTKVFLGHRHDFENNLLRCCWSPDGKMISCGSADRMVYVWNTSTRAIMYSLPGHNGSVNMTDFHPEEPIILSCSSDKQIYLGEINPIF